MEGRPSIRVKLMFHDNPHGADPATTVEGVLTFPGRGYKGVVKPGQLWDCDVVFASHNYVMIAPRVELEDALDTELGVLRLHQGAREVAHLKLNDAMDLLRSGQIPPPALTPRPLPPRRPTVAPAKPSFGPAPPPAAPSRAPPATPAGASPPPPTSLPTVTSTAPTAPTPTLSAAAAVPLPASPPPAPPRPAPPTEPTPTSPAPETRSIVPSQAPTQVPSSATAPARPVPLHAASGTRTVDDWRRALDAPEGRALVELLADRLGVSSALPRIEDTIDGQEEILSVLRGEAGDIRRSVKDLGAQIEDVRKQTLAWRRKENQDLRGVPKPVPKDPDHPTDEEIEREVIHQLYQKNCWGNKYGQYEKLKRGYNSKASDRQVRAAVQRLQEKRWILIYAKDTDQFRLNPARAEDVYRVLGVADRAADQLAEETRDELDEPGGVTKRDLDQAVSGLATRADVERLVAPLRQKVSALEDRPASAAVPLPIPDAATHRNADLAEIKGLLRGLQGELNRVKKLAEDTASAQRRLEARLDAELTEPAEG